LAPARWTPAPIKNEMGMAGDKNGDVNEAIVAALSQLCWRIPTGFQKHPNTVAWNDPLHR